MRASRSWWLGTTAAAALLVAGDARGQSVLFVTPDRGETGVGQTIGLAALRADGLGGAAAPSPWPTERVTWMFVRCGGGQRNYEPGTPAPNAGKPGPSVEIEALDAALIGLDLAPRDEEFAGGALIEWGRKNIEAKRLPKDFDGLAGRDKVVVRRVESAKVIVRGRGAGELVRGDRGGRPVRSATATDKSGQTVEIRPMLDPTSAVLPTDMPVRLYAFMEGAKFAQLRVEHVASGDERRLTCDEKGIAWVRLEKPGEYRLSFHALAPFAAAEGEGSRAQWALHTATCTFVVPDLPRADGAQVDAPGAATREEEKSR